MRFRLQDRLRSFPSAFRGVGVLIATQHNARVHLAATVFVLALGGLIHLSSGEWIALFFALMLVWVTDYAIRRAAPDRA